MKICVAEGCQNEATGQFYPYCSVGCEKIGMKEMTQSELNQHWNDKRRRHLEIASSQTATEISIEMREKGEDLMSRLGMDKAKRKAFGIAMSYLNNPDKPIMICSPNPAAAKIFLRMVAEEIEKLQSGPKIVKELILPMGGDDD